MSFVTFLTVHMMTKWMQPQMHLMNYMKVLKPFLLIWDLHDE
ncbi:Uncharacterised protein [Acinetobacter baumannii]|nr:Uncharacterised protein [Acinetobacter baumannii]